MLRVGLTGGLASGKSNVGNVLEELGCVVIKADEIGHRLLAPEGAAYEKVVAEFGKGILNEQGNIVRQKLGQIVFADSSRLNTLSGIIHPLVFEEEERRMREAASSDPHAISVVEAAILIETGRYREYEKIVLAWCPPEMQIERAMRRDNLSREAVEQRLRNQMSLEEKREFAHFVIDTSGPKEQTRVHVLKLYEQLRRLAS
jgi:dephospho-CoA kinase